MITFSEEYILSKFEKIPKIDIGDQLGSTGYIDFLTWDRITEPVMYGIDCLGRLFIVLKMDVNGRRYMQTFFQRYTNINSTWVSDINNSIMGTTGGLHDTQMEFIIELIENGTATLKKEHRSLDFINDVEVVLYKDKDIDIEKDISYELNKINETDNYKKIFDWNWFDWLLGYTD